MLRAVFDILDLQWIFGGLAIPPPPEVIQEDGGIRQAIQEEFQITQVLSEEFTILRVKTEEFER